MNRLPPPAREAKLTKQGRVLRALYGGEKLTRGESWPRYGDACLHSTVALLQGHYGLRIDRELIPVEGRFGKARVARYWIDSAELDNARRALAAELVKAGAYRTAAEALAALEGE